MDANINSIVRDLKKVTVYQVVFEAITNSIQANASNIEIYFIARNKSVDEDSHQIVDEIKVVDDGVGFNDENIKSFKTYRSDYKKNLGAKGVGRFLYLKLFEQVNISSLSNEITFTLKNDVEVNESKTTYSTTTLQFLTPRKREQIDKVNFEQQVKSHFLPYFKLLKNENKSVKITVFFNGTETHQIDSSEIPIFDSVTFDIENHEFNLSYILNDPNIDSNDGFYCAANRVVLRNKELDINFKSFNGVNILFLLSSEYFDQNVNDERDEFTIKPIQTNQDLFSNLSWADIQKALSVKIKAVCLQHGIDVEQEAKKNLEESIKIAPFLAHYLDKKNESVLSSEELIKNAKNAYEKEKNFLRNPKSKADATYNVILNRVVQSELAEYIFDREKIINKLKSITDEELMEKEIHNLFMPQYTTNDNSKNYRSNNLWLFDDRFMTYDKVFSEAHVKTIFPELANVTKRFDLFSIVSNTYEKDCITDIVIIELKRPDDTITPAGAEEQLLEYARYVNNSTQQNKIRIWTYAFLKFNQEIEDRLYLDKSYNRIPTGSQYPIYYKYHERPNMIINFMDYTALANDAHTRNQTFINILKGSTFDVHTK